MLSDAMVAIGYRFHVSEFNWLEMYAKASDSKFAVETVQVVRNSLREIEVISEKK
jgi:hypothetical protein